MEEPDESQMRELRQALPGEAEQLLILNRSRHRSPILRVCDRIVAGLCTLLMRPGRLIRSAIVVNRQLSCALHRALVHQKYRLLFSPEHRAKPGPKGPRPDLIPAVIEMKQRNRVGSPILESDQAARQIGLGVTTSQLLLGRANAPSVGH